MSADPMRLSKLHPSSWRIFDQELPLDCGQDLLAAVRFAVSRSVPEGLRAADPRSTAREACEMVPLVRSWVKAVLDLHPAPAIEAVWRLGGQEALRGITLSTEVWERVCQLEHDRRRPKVERP